MSRSGNQTETARLIGIGPRPLTWWRIAAFAAAALVGAVVALFALRAPIAEWFAEAYLTSEGANSEVRIEHWDRSGLTAQLKVGNAPDFVADRVTLTFDPQHWLPHVESVSVAGTHAYAYFDGHSLSFGPLQRLVNNLTAKRKATRSWTDQFVRDPLPLSIDDAHATVETPSGPIEVTGRFQVLGPQIRRAQAHVARAELRRNGFSMHLEAAAFSGGWTGEGFDASGTFSLKADTPAGSAAATPQAVHATLTLHGLRARKQDATTIYSLRSLALRAEATGGLANLAANAAVLTVQIDDLLGSYESGRLSGDSKVSASFTAQDARLGTIPIDHPMLAFIGDASVSGGRTVVAGRLSGSAALPATASRALARSLPVLGSDAHLVSAFAAASRGLRVDSQLRVARDDYVTAITFLSPTIVTGADGTKFALAPVRESEATLAISDGGIVGASNVRLGGGSLPSANLAIDSFSYATDGFDATFRGSVSGTTSALRNAAIAGAGRISDKNRSFAVVLNGCADARVGEVLAGRKPVITDIHARFCTPRGQPLVSARGDWRMAADLASLSGTFVGAQSRFERAQGRITLEGGSSGLSTGSADFAGGRLSDVFASRRFEPLSVSGHAKLADGVWRGSAAIKTESRNKQIGSVRFSHTLATGTGEADIEARDVLFVPDKFAPADISPLLVAIARADGRASFTGHITWTQRELKSDGQLDVDALQFASPLGGAHGTTTHIRFISLLPPETAPNQALGIERVEWMSPLNGVTAHFRLTPGAIELGGASAQVADGTATVDPLTINFSNKTLSGVLKISEIDLGSLLAGSNLGNKIHVQARLSGTIPFSLTNEGIRIANGFVAATKPGRISIDRSLWTSGAALSSNAMQDFAYQAMENLAFDRLQGKINSLPGGRLGLLLHIVGRNDPPKQEDARIGLFALLRGEAFKEKVPLPKGTPIDLTLDTSLNFDELLRAYQAARSPSVEVKSK